MRSFGAGLAPAMGCPQAGSTSTLMIHPTPPHVLEPHPQVRPWGRGEPVAVDDHRRDRPVSRGSQDLDVASHDLTLPVAPGSSTVHPPHAVVHITCRNRTYHRNVVSLTPEAAEPPESGRQTPKNQTRLSPHTKRHRFSGLYRCAWQTGVGGGALFRRMSETPRGSTVVAECGGCRVWGSRRSRGAEGSRGRGVEEPRSRGVECGGRGGAEEPRGRVWGSRSRGVEGPRGRGAEEPRGRGVEGSRGRGVEEPRGRGVEGSRGRGEK